MLKLEWFNQPIKKAVAAQPHDGLSEIPHLLPKQTVAELLTPHHSFLVQIEELAGLAKEPFNGLYLAAIQRFARFVQQLPASEVHHHAGPGGILMHTLEVSVVALKVRRSYLLSETGGAEEIAAKQDLWTYAVFLAALCHDLAKVAVDQTVTLFDRNRQQQTWDPWNQFMDEQGIGYIAEFVPNRTYRLHEKATPLLTHKIIPSQGMRWLTSDRGIFARWLASVSGDLENAGSLGQIVGIADSQSVAANLGADDSRMPSVKTIPLHEKMLTALRYLLAEGTLPLNRNGAAGWIQGEYCWMVSKRTVDAVREHLIREGHTGIPTKNSRLFDLWQEHAVLIPNGDKAIWTASIAGEGWCNELTLIKIPLAKIWTNPARKPEPFEGRISVIESNPSAADDINDATPNDSQTDSTFDLPANIIDSGSMEFDFGEMIIHESNDGNDEHLKALRDFKLDEQSNSAGLSAKEPADQVDDFFTWLQNGIRQEVIKTNQPKARVHVVKEGVALMTPGIFQDYAVFKEGDSSNWPDIQKKVLKKNCHVRDGQGLNVVKYQVTGASKSTTVNAILFEDVSIVFAAGSAPASNPHLQKAT
ncbi:MobH family relaxase [Methylomonas methanica]|uniref:Integrating conjugative element relaxase, PFGI-1 class n=1 Tax=Methylomonas methanica (strain DSM 25384 / MC09) TaxID=857087 RepID=G0A5Z9_METMM|nr:MobH family relaxase [Methylomonas methanica]AEG00449.1 integrating conjugative element relaxase, PFGI-1 class [Methylomonas methanica MC09]